MPKKYKILLSAYACEPNRGSEPGVGWHWSLKIAKRGHKVWVLTRKNNKEVIDAYFKDKIKPENLEFLYYDLPNWFIKYKRWFGVHVYYYLWQLGILRFAKKHHKINKFDLIHHITFVTIHQPSFLYKIKGVPFFYGPTAGGDRIPSSLLKSFPMGTKFREYVRLLQITFLKYDPIRLRMFKKSTLVFTNSNDTKQSLPSTFYAKTGLSLAIGIDISSNKLIKQINTSNKIQLLYVGNLIPLKGLDILIKGYNKVKHRCALTIVGKGNIKKFARTPNEIKDITHINYIHQKKLISFYNSFDVFVFPSLRDSGGMVILEALEQGLPVICLDLGGPGQIVNDTCGRVISTKGKTENEVVDALSCAVLELQQDLTLLKQLSEGAVKRAAEFTWEKTVANVYDQIELFMEKSIKLNVTK